MPDPLRYHEICKIADQSALSSSFFYLEGGDPALIEDLADGFKAAFRGSRQIVRENIVSVDGKADELITELDSYPVEMGDAYKFILVRNAERLWTPKTMEPLISRLERDELNPRVRLILSGQRPGDGVVKFFTDRKAYGMVTQPSFEKVGAWLGARTLGRKNYQRLYGTPLIDPADGQKVMEKLGWSWAAALQAVRTIQVMTDEPMTWERISALIPSQVGYGYSDALLFGRGRRGALRLSEGILESEVLRTLGLVRWNLQKFAFLRAIEAEKMSDREAALQAKLHIWRYRTKYKKAYPSYDNERLRLRFTALDEARMQARTGVTDGVLEVLALRW